MICLLCLRRASVGLLMMMFDSVVYIPFIWLLVLGYVTLLVLLVIGYSCLDWFVFCCDCCCLLRVVCVGCDFAVVWRPVVVW